eukprot:1399174-Ditylum_brightwellii.AAC.1
METEICGPDMILVVSRCKIGHHSSDGGCAGELRVWSQVDRALSGPVLDWNDVGPEVRENENDDVCLLRSDLEGKPLSSDEDKHQPYLCNASECNNIVDYSIATVSCEKRDLSDESTTLVGESQNSGLSDSIFTNSKTCDAEQNEDHT